MTNEGIFPKSDGDILYASEVNRVHTNINEITKQQLQQNINILISAESSSANLENYDTMISDRFIDADGQLNTVDTTNTTANFNTNSYNNLIYTSSLTDSGTFVDGNQTIYLHANEDGYLTQLKLNFYCNNQISGSGVNWEIIQNTTTLASGLANTYTNTTSVQTVTINLTLTDYTSPILEGDFQINLTAGGNSTVKTISNFTGSSLYLTAPNPTSMTSGFTFTTNTPEKNLIVQTNPQTIDNGVKYVQIYSNHITEGTGNITADISLDGGLTYTTGIALDTVSKITSSDGTSLIMKLNLNGTGNGNTASVANYSMMLFY